MTLADSLALAAFVLTVISLIVGAAWWMSALYGRVGGIGEHVTRIDEKLDTVIDDNKTDKAALWKAIHNTDSRVHEIDVRVTRVEAKVEDRL